jgi:hypothetical protein
VLITVRRIRLSLARNASRIGAAATGLTAIVGTVYGVWGPPWPTSPEIRTSGVDPSSAFAFPFRMVNRSVLFRMHIDQVDCAAGSGTKLAKVMLPYLSSAVFDSHTIKADEAYNYSCSPLLRIAGTPARSFEMTVTATYHNAFYKGVTEQCFEWINADRYSRWITGCEAHRLLE